METEFREVLNIMITAGSTEKVTFKQMLYLIDLKRLTPDIREEPCRQQGQQAKALGQDHISSVGGGAVRPR